MKISMTYLGNSYYDEAPEEFEGVCLDTKVVVQCPTRRPDKSIFFDEKKGRLTYFTSLNDVFFVLVKMDSYSFHLIERETGMIVAQAFCKTYKEAMKDILEYSNFRSILTSSDMSQWNTMYQAGLKKVEDLKKKCS